MSNRLPRNAVPTTSTLRLSYRTDSRAVESDNFGIFHLCLRSGSVNRLTSGYLILSLLPDRLAPYLDAFPHQILVIEQQVLLQSEIGYIANIGGFLYGDVFVSLQHFHSLHLLLRTERAASTRQVVIDTQAMTCPFAELQNLRIVRAQLLAEVGAVQFEITGYL